MTTFIRNKPYTGPVKAVVLDWAGTAVDHGCMGPAAVFVEAFKRFGVAVSLAEARGPMGAEKRHHVRLMCAEPEVAGRWHRAHGRDPDEAAQDSLYTAVEELMVKAIADHAEPVPGLLDFVAALRDRGVAIGSCSGYTAPMMAVLVPAAAKQGYSPDVAISSSEVPAGRPWPWMCFLNAMKLGVQPMEAMVKIGDTVADIHEGLNAGMWTVGVVRTGNDLGLTEAEAKALGPGLRPRLEQAARKLKAAGAHYVVDSVADCLTVLDDVQRRLAKGEIPAPAGAHPAVFV